MQWEVGGDDRSVSPGLSMQRVCGEKVAVEVCFKFFRLFMWSLMLAIYSMSWEFS